MIGSMRASVKAIVLIAAICVPLMLLPGPGDAKQVAGLLNIEEGRHYGWRLDVAIPSEIDFKVIGINGSRVDVLVLDQENYTSYSQGEPFSYYEEYSALDTDNYSCNMSVLSGSVYIVLDNSKAPDLPAAAQPSGPARVKYWVGSTFDFHNIPSYGPSWMIYVVLAAVAAVLVLVIISTRKAIRERKRTSGS